MLIHFFQRTLSFYLFFSHSLRLYLPRPVCSKLKKEKLSFIDKTTYSSEREGTCPVKSGSCFTGIGPEDHTGT
jgi:hypothetical protein